MFVIWEFPTLIYLWSGNSPSLCLDCPGIPHFYVFAVWEFPMLIYLW
jgi:hypothetical protein